jgi:hypothetical protein
MYWGCFEPFRHYLKVRAKRAELVPLTHKFSKQSCIGTFHNERTRSTPLDPNLKFWGHFESFRYCTKVGAKLTELLPLTCVGIFHNELTRSTPLDQKHVLGPFRTVSLLHESWCKTGRTSVIHEQVCQMKLHQNFLQRTHPFHPIGPQNSCFGGVSNCFFTAQKSMQNRPNFCH